MDLTKTVLSRLDPTLSFVKLPFTKLVLSIKLFPLSNVHTDYEHKNLEGEVFFLNDSFFHDFCFSFINDY